MLKNPWKRIKILIFVTVIALAVFIGLIALLLVRIAVVKVERLLCDLYISPITRYPTSRNPTNRIGKHFSLALRRSFPLK
jgi:hypothetical protein